MTIRDISLAKDPDLRASLQALQRAAQLAKKTAIQTNTHLVIMKNGQLTHISAQQLQAQEAVSTQASKLI